MPEGDVLPAWAADPHKQQSAHLVFKNVAGGAGPETLLLQAAYCVSYHEEFAAGDAGNGAYVCHLVLSDPDGWTLQAGRRVHNPGSPAHGKNPSAPSCGSSHWPSAPWAAFTALRVGFVGLQL